MGLRWTLRHYDAFATAIAYAPEIVIVTDNTLGIVGRRIPEPAPSMIGS
eukprot:gene11653-10321_t